MVSYVSFSHWNMDPLHKLLLSARCNRLTIPKDVDDVISKLIEVGGRDLLFDKEQYGQNCLHHAASSCIFDEVVSKMIGIGGKDLILAKSNDYQNAL